MEACCRSCILHSSSVKEEFAKQFDLNSKSIISVCNHLYLSKNKQYLQIYAFSFLGQV